MAIPAKRPFSEIDDCFPPKSKDAAFSSPAAQFNCRVMKRLTRVLEKDPQADLATYLPIEYSLHLAKKVERDASAVTTI